MALSTHDELILLRKRARRRLVGAVVIVSVSTVVLWNVVKHLPDQQMKPESVEIAGEASSGVSDAVATEVGKAVVASSPAGKMTIAKPAASASAAAVTQLPASLEPTPAEIKPKVAQIATPQPQSKPVEPAHAVVSKPEPAVAQNTHPAHEQAAKPERVKEKDKEEAPPKAHKAAAPDPAAILEGRADSEAPRKPAKADSESAHAAAGQAIIQLAALSDEAKAEALKAKLSGLGVQARFSKVNTSKGEVTRVRVGPFASRAEADRVLQKLSKAGVTGIIVSK